MTVHVLWSVARSRSTAFFRSMLERSDLVALHEPLEGLAYIGPVEVGSRRFETPQSLVDWLLDETTDTVFMKETLAPRVTEIVYSNGRFLSEIQHAFLIRRPEEIAASFFALEGDMRIHDTGVKALYELYVSVRNSSGLQPVIIDSDDLVTRPVATMRAYCAAVGLPFIAEAMSWQAGVRPEWQRTERWHTEASASTGFFQEDDPDRHALAGHSEVLRFASLHRPFYEQLRSERLQIDP